ncbi:MULTISPECIES: trypsin-like serine peptidase [unclassified Nostoc]|uniref:trypsin-like serine peptidase n=1 Tax=unclassified Nostoc TaxID=2593658 RepID=UPI002AD548E7|nr:trypsin-like serine protease [Nostoc sp. DedQUE03]MDZ7971488.1 trypsin-like serine protease [Nostoc sp. DedQUE03]MDZ8046482.1 trypsin-like serine protease [Nostoc sp. DedQUE02]
MQVFVRQSLAIVSTGLLLSLQSYGAIAQNRSLTVSSDSVNQSYRTGQFNTLPEKQLKSRMPISSVKPPANAAFSTGTIIGTPGAVGSNNGQSQQNEQLDLPINTPLSFGNSKLPYTTSRVLGGTTNPAQNNYYRRAGKLYMAVGGTTYNYICSASMIGKSLLITAAHCVHDYGKGSNGWVKKVKFVPAKNNSSEPYLSFESTQYIIPTAYFNGTDTCTQTGVVCNNDIALVALNNNSSGQQAGNLTGWFGYGWNGYSYAVPAAAYQSVFGNKLFASITQLGYPGSFDSGLRMQINTAYGAYYATGNLKNTWLGSAMTGGSSGGPWLVNFGEDASGGDYGSSNVRNSVVGVTSYGNSEQQMGSSWFGQNQQFPNAAYGTRGAGNIGKLVYDACDNPALSAWQLQSKGRCR